MLAITLFTTLLTSTSVLACYEHNYHALHRRAGETGGVAWDYSNTDWASLSPDFAACQHGIMQAPIGLRLDQGIGYTHTPNFEKYDVKASGSMINWGFGPAMTLAHAEGDFSTLPTMSFEENGVMENVHLIGWHIHAPSDHVVDGIRSKAEMHMVHVNSKGDPRMVVAIRIAPGVATSEWFASMPHPVHYRDAANTTIEGSINPMQAIREVGNLKEYWTYQGKLLIVLSKGNGSLYLPR